MNRPAIPNTALIAKFFGVQLSKEGKRRSEKVVKKKYSDDEEINRCKYVCMDAIISPGKYFNFAFSGTRSPQLNIRQNQ